LAYEAPVDVENASLGVDVDNTEGAAARSCCRDRVGIRADEVAPERPVVEERTLADDVEQTEGAAARSCCRGRVGISADEEATEWPWTRR
jgi:hypothetical protein